LPFKENSRTIQLITAEDIKNPEWQMPMLYSKLQVLM
jgi:hypothetical protein